MKLSLLFWKICFVVVSSFVVLACSPPEEKEAEPVSESRIEDSSPNESDNHSSPDSSDTRHLHRGRLPAKGGLFERVSSVTVTDADDNSKTTTPQRNITSAQAKPPSEADTDLNSVVSKLAVKLDSERNSVLQTLQELGYEPLNNFSEQVSAKSQLEFAMQRAEVGSGYKNGAKNLLIYFRDKYQTTSADMLIDPVLVGLGDATNKKFVFSTDVSVSKKVDLDSLGLREAVEHFARHQPPFFELKPSALGCCIKNGDIKKFERIVLASKNHMDFFDRLLKAEAPPPTPKQKMRVFARSYQSQSIARQIDPALNKIIDGLESRLPERYQIVAEAKPSGIPTFAKQEQAFAEAADDAAARGDQRVADFIRSIHVNKEVSGIDAIEDAIEKNANVYSPSSGSRVSPSAQAKGTVLAVKAYDRFIKETFESANSISKKFVSASRSIRGPGGVSLGAEIVRQPRQGVTNVAWIFHSSRPEFGYFLFQFNDENKTLARSKWLYSESAAAAWIAMFNPISTRAEYKEGDIFTVVTIDRFYEGELSESEQPVAINPALMGFQLAWASSRVDFWFSIGENVKKDIIALYCNNRAEDCGPLQKEPSQSAWEAVAQLATWQFHDKEHQILLSTSKQVADLAVLAVCPIDDDSCFDQNTPSSHLTVSPFASEDLIKPQIVQQLVSSSAQECETQTTEDGFMSCLLLKMKENMDIIIKFAMAEGTSTELKLITDIVDSLDSVTKPVNLKAWIDENMELDPEPRDELVSKIQPLVDWLTEYHPDFIRLNDFAEAFTLLRWARSSGLTGNDITGLSAEEVPAIYPIPKVIELSVDGLKAKAN